MDTRKQIIRLLKAFKNSDVDSDYTLHYIITILNRSNSDYFLKGVLIGACIAIIYFSVIFGISI
jgi:hypothetical protein